MWGRGLDCCYCGGAGGVVEFVTDAAAAAGGRVVSRLVGAAAATAVVVGIWGGVLWPSCGARLLLWGRDWRYNLRRSGDSLSDLAPRRRLLLS